MQSREDACSTLRRVRRENTRGERKHTRQRNKYLYGGTFPKLFYILLKPCFLCACLFGCGKDSIAILHRPNNQASHILPLCSLSSQLSLVSSHNFSSPPSLFSSPSPLQPNQKFPWWGHSLKALFSQLLISSLPLSLPFPPST